MAFDPRKISRPEDALQYMQNARRLGNNEAFRAGFRRYCELRGVDSDSDLEGDVLAAIAAFEQVRSEARGRTVVASRTRQKLARDGAIKLVEDLAIRPVAAEGFDTLIEAGLWDFTFEALVLKHKKLFSETTITAARKRLSEAGVALPD